MKKYFSAIAICLLGMGVFSCSDDNEPLINPEVEPGVYDVEMRLAVESNDSNPVTRGIRDDNTAFDTNYDYDCIYLHVKGSEESLRLPVYHFSCNLQGVECDKGFRYRVELKTDGSAVVTAINENYTDDASKYGDSLEIPAGSSCYFSSLETSSWKLPDTQIFERDTYTFYQRKKDINAEVYRSRLDYTAESLTVSCQEFTLVRACAGFNALGLFYDGADIPEVIDPEDIPPVYLSKSEFTSIMGSEPSKWYIKIYIGGPDFTNEYDLDNQESIGDKVGGYYSSGDATLFDEGEIDTNKFLSFAQRSYGYGELSYTGYGYYTRVGNNLITPVVGGEVVDVYILIKHWTGEGEPDDSWLLDDSNALRTKVNTTVDVNPANNNFYTIGLLMEIRKFKEAWDAAGGDAAAATRSAGGPREFTIEGAKVVYDVY